MYGKALEDGVADAPSAAAAAYHDSYAVEPAWAGDLSKLPPGVARIVDGTRKLFEVCCDNWYCLRLMPSRLIQSAAS